jgi:RNA polymerase sigma factor (sigma-70 family)
MDDAGARSGGVSETLTAPASGTRDSSWERFESLYRSSRDDIFDRRRGEERAWLFGIARNAALDELRRRRRVASLVTDPEDVTEQDAGDDAEVALRRTTVQTALAKLPAREREIVALKFHAGMSNAELARVLGISESNAGTLLYRTMEKLRKACNATA